MSTLFRSPEPMPEPGPEPAKNEEMLVEDTKDLEPIDGDKADVVILSSIGVDDASRNLPETDKSNLEEVKNYIADILKAKGILPTTGAYNRTLNNIKERLELDPDTEPSVMLDRIGGIVKAWKSLSFVNDLQERRSIFMRLARQPDSKSMDRLIMDEMDHRKIWQ